MREFEDRSSLVGNLLELSGTRSSCFCLQGSTKLNQAFGPWRGNSANAPEIPQKGRNRSHVCGGSYFLDSLAHPDPFHPLKSLQPRRCIKKARSVGHRTTKYRRNQKGCMERDFTAFQHLESCKDYTEQYRMNKFHHQAFTVSGPTAVSERQKKFKEQSRISWAIKYDKYDLKVANNLL